MPIKFLTQETLKQSLKKALEEYWSIPNNRKIDGKLRSDLLDQLEIQDIDVRIQNGGGAISQFELLLEAIRNEEKFPSLQGRFQTKRIIDNGNATCSVDCDFELGGKDYRVEKNGDITINNILIHFRQ